MYLNILKKDLKRKKTMNVILLLFVILATTFISGSVSNIIAILNGTDHFFRVAGVGDYVIFHSGDEASGEELIDVLEGSGAESFVIEEMLMIPPKDIYVGGAPAEDIQFFVLAMPVENAGLNIFDARDEKITSVEQGTVYMPAYCLKALGVSVGDSIGINTGDGIAELEIAGICKDPIYGAKMFNTPRFLVSSVDFSGLNGTGCRTVYASAEDQGSIRKAVADLSGVLFSDSTEVLKRMFLADVVVAAVLLVVSVCLILIAVVVLKFTISFTLTEEFREIGVMKAIGIRNSSIRTLYTVKYIAVAVAGSVIGFFLSFPFGTMMLRSVSEQMVLGSNSGILVNIISTVVVVLTVFVFSRLCTSGVKRSTPLDAIRNGQTGERFSRRRGLRLGRSRGRAVSFLAVNDVVSSPKRYMTLMIAFTLCLTIVLTIVITASTLSGETLLPSFGVADCDAFLHGDLINIEDVRRPDGEEMIVDRLSEIENELAAEGIPAVCFVEMQINVTVDHDGETGTFRCQKNSGYIDPAEYEYVSGCAPADVSEIAVSTLIAEELGVHVGDSLMIRNSGGNSYKFMITGTFETMNNLGKLIRVHPDLGVDMSQLSAAFDVQVRYTDDPDKQEREARFEKLRKMYGEDGVLTVGGFVEDCIGVGGMIDSLKYLVLAVTMIVTALVTVLMERSFIAKEKSETALMKAIGFRNSAVTGVHTLRFLIVSAAASVMAGIISIPVTKLCITPVFSLFGVRRVIYEIHPVEVFIIYPAAVIGITVVTAFLTSLYTGTIKAADTSNIE